MAEWIAHRKELWVEYRITNKNKTPSHMTYRRILQQIISVEEFEKLLKEYHQQFMEKRAGSCLQYGWKKRFEEQFQVESGGEHIY